VSTLQVIVGSTRADRNADRVVPWVLDRARRHPAFTVDLLDLRDWPLPFFQETLATIGDRADPTYSDPVVREWNRRVQQGDAYLFVTPEYNHSVPGVLKNAIDNVFVSYAFRNKPAAAVGYSGGNVGGARAVEHLAHILIEAECVPLRNTVLVGGVLQAFDADGEPVNPLTDTALEIALDDLAWWSAALEAARAGGELPTGNRRLGAAMAARRR
jgi:NAD(P)H-dependent FMN reductase